VRDLGLLGLLDAGFDLTLTLGQEIPAPTSASTPQGRSVTRTDLLPAGAVEDLAVSPAVVARLRPSEPAAEEPGA
jgi:hypothetical protein